MQVVLRYRQPVGKQGILTYKLLSDDLTSTLLEGDFQTYQDLRLLSNFLTSTTDRDGMGIFTHTPIKVILHRENGCFIHIFPQGQDLELTDPFSVKKYILEMVEIINVKFKEKYPLKDVICSFTVLPPY